MCISADRQTDTLSAKHARAHAHAPSVRAQIWRPELQRFSSSSYKRSFFSSPPLSVSCCTPPVAPVVLAREVLHQRVFPSFFWAAAVSCSIRRPEYSLAAPPAIVPPCSVSRPTPKTSPLLVDPILNLQVIRAI